MDPDKDDEDLEDIVEPITSEDLDLLDNEGDVERPTLEESAAGPSSTSSLPTLNLPSTSRASPDMFADLDTDSSLIPPPPVVIPVLGSGVRKQGRLKVASNTSFGDPARPSNKKRGKGKSWTLEFECNSEQEVRIEGNCCFYVFVPNLNALYFSGRTRNCSRKFKI